MSVSLAVGPDCDGYINTNDTDAGPRSGTAGTSGAAGPSGGGPSGGGAAGGSRRGRSTSVAGGRWGRRNGVLDVG